MKLVLNLTLAALTALAVSCAQLSPQQIDFQPSIPTEGLIRGEGSTSLMVVDQRTNQIIGYRGGAYAETSSIVAKQPLVEVVESLAKQVIAETGLELSTAFPDYNMTIKIDELSYVTEDVKASIKRSTAVAKVSVDVQKENLTFANSYKTSQYIETLGYPKEEKNEELLNNVFDAVLERMFSDQELAAFLAKE